MGQSAWWFQDPKQVKRVGEKKSSWYVGWYDPNGVRRSKSCGPGSDGKKLAFRLAKQIEAELLTGTYEDTTPKRWPDFRARYESTVLERKSAADSLQAQIALNKFEAHCKPDRLDRITTETVDLFISLRLRDRGRKKGETIAPATVNKNLRYIRAALKRAVKWKLMSEEPEYDWLPEPGTLPRYVIPDHFAMIYAGADVAMRPNIPNVAPAEWWRGLLTFAYMTGWRIGQILALRREDVDLESGYCVTRHDDNKGKRDDRAPLHPVVVEHLRGVLTFDVLVFPWPHGRERLYAEFERVQRAASISLPCHEKHEHTPACHRYGFHDLRRGFASLNASRLGADELRSLMQHRSFETTRRYINLAESLAKTAAKVHVPEFLLPAELEGNWRDSQADGSVASS